MLNYVIVKKREREREDEKMKCLEYQVTAKAKIWQINAERVKNDYKESLN